MAAPFVERTRRGRPPAIPMTNDERLQQFLRRAAFTRKTTFNGLLARNFKERQT